MNTSKKAGSILFAIALLTSSAFAGETLAGIWHGRIRFDMASLPRLKNPRANSARMASLAKLQQVELTLTLKGDNSYTLKTMGGGQTSTQITGSWRDNGKTISLQRMDHGKEYGYPQVYTVDPSRKSFAVTKDQTGITTTISFFR